MTSDPLIQIFSDVLGVPEQELNEETSPENTPQWDSMRSMELVAVIEDTYNIRMTTKEIMKTRSIGIVRQLLSEKNAGKSQAE